MTMILTRPKKKMRVIKALPLEEVREVAEAVVAGAVVNQEVVIMIRRIKTWRSKEHTTLVEYLN